MPPPGTSKNTDDLKGAELLKFKCGRCGRCCRLWIPVTDEDVRRLMKSTDLPAQKIVKFIDPSRLGSSSGTITWIKFGPGKKDRRAMCLREVRDRCLFLKDNQCTVYESRPVVCREHPFVLTLDDAGRKISSIELNNACHCSHTLEGKIYKRTLKKVYRWNLRQDESYFNKVRRWNRRRSFGTERDFVCYLGLA